MYKEGNAIIISILNRVLLGSRREKERNTAKPTIIVFHDSMYKPIFVTSFQVDVDRESFAIPGNSYKKLLYTLSRGKCSSLCNNMTIMIS